MRELIPGLHDWTTFHDGTGARVGSQHVDPPGRWSTPVAALVLRVSRPQTV